tara:strand:- start:298 stop:492 length:195 start_codon:yes stop_codon:yes gene_type:complete
MTKFIKFFILIIIINNVSTPAFGRCAVCYTNGLSGASIAVIVIVFSFLLLFIGNKFLQKFLNRS